MKPLKQAIREHLSVQQLTQEQLDVLTAMQEEADPLAEPHRQQRAQRRGHWSQAGWAGAAVAAVMLAAIAVWLTSPGTNMAQLIAEEVVHNHIKLKPLEVESDDMGVIRGYFEQLDFAPVQSRLIADAGLEILGGRYCSIQGIDAAQLRARRPHSREVQSIYQTVYDPKVFKDLPGIEQGQSPIELYVKGIKVRMWVEKGLLFAMTVAEDSGHRPH